jgi:hypothetical protein
MKKLVLAVAALGLISLTSCKKKYTCSCTITAGGVSTTIEGTSEEKMSKKDAKTQCEEGNYSTPAGKSECKLK